MKINEIFYSIQGEGYYSGTPAVFIRISSCNLHCPFCDTQHEEGREIECDDLVAEARLLSPDAWLCVITGGEPGLKVREGLIDRLHEAGFTTVAIETNGTINNAAFKKADFITCSPKFEFCGEHARVNCPKIDELKVVYNMDNNLSLYEPIIEKYGIKRLYLQPCDTGDDILNREIREAVVEVCKKDPRWRISLQTQKILSVR